MSRIAHAARDGKVDRGDDNPAAMRRSAEKPKSRKEAEQVEHIEERSTPPTPVIYETVRRYGEEEMARPAASLWWSGLAAGLSMSFSLLAEAILRMHLPDAAWRPLVVAFGYPIGFLMVILGRQQLFTENTITVVLPIVAQPSANNFLRGGRMWGIVLAANLAGTLVAALFLAFTPVVDDALRQAMLAISREALDHPVPELALRGITAGFLMAALVWLIPASESAQFYVIVVMTWLIGVSGSAHIIAGSLGAFLLLAGGELGASSMLGTFLLPVLAGNIVGGTVLFAMIAYGQVMKEL